MTIRVTQIFEYMMRQQLEHNQSKRMQQHWHVSTSRQMQYTNPLRDLALAALGFLFRCPQFRDECRLDVGVTTQFHLDTIKNTK